MSRSMTIMERIEHHAPDALACLFGVSSIVHFVRPQVFESLIPSVIPNPRAVVYISGVAELACALGLIRRTRWAGYASALLLIGVFPGNVQMTVNAVHNSHGRLTTSSSLLSIARLPLQVPLIWAALQANKRRRDPSR